MGETARNPWSTKRRAIRPTSQPHQRCLTLLKPHNSRSIVEAYDRKHTHTHTLSHLFRLVSDGSRTEDVPPLRPWLLPIQRRVCFCAHRPKRSSHVHRRAPARPATERVQIFCGRQMPTRLRLPLRPHLLLRTADSYDSPATRPPTAPAFGLVHKLLLDNSLAKKTTVSLLLFRLLLCASRPPFTL